MNLDIKVNRIFLIEKGNFVKAFADILINNAIMITGFKILSTKQGLVVAMPQEQAKDKRWYDTVRCLDLDIKAEISRVVLEAYQAECAVA